MPHCTSGFTQSFHKQMFEQTTTELSWTQMLLLYGRPIKGLLHLKCPFEPLVNPG
jgi:hypothetical protein